MIFGQTVYLFFVLVLRNCPKSNELMSIAKENLRQPNIDSVAWLLVITDGGVYNEKAGREKRNTKHTIKRVKRTPGDLLLESRFILKEIMRLRKAQSAKK